jgi:hypothetical protein
MGQKFLNSQGMAMEDELADFVDQVLSTKFHTKL